MCHTGRLCTASCDSQYFFVVSRIVASEQKVFWKQSFYLHEVLVWSCIHSKFLKPHMWDITRYYVIIVNFVLSQNQTNKLIQREYLFFFQIYFQVVWDFWVIYFPINYTIRTHTKKKGHLQFLCLYSFDGVGEGNSCRAEECSSLIQSIVCSFKSSCSWIWWEKNWNSCWILQAFARGCKSSLWGSWAWRSTE